MSATELTEIKKYGKIKFYRDNYFEIELDNCKLVIFLPEDYPERSIPEINLVEKPGKSAWFKQKDLDNQLIHLWESSEHSYILNDLLDWVTNPEEDEDALEEIEDHC